MTLEELKELGMSQEELSTLNSDFKKAWDSGRFKFGPEVLTEERIKGLRAIKHRPKDGQVMLNSVDVHTVLFMRTILDKFNKITRAVQAANGEVKNIAEGVEENTPPEKLN